MPLVFLVTIALFALTLSHPARAEKPAEDSRPVTHEAALQHGYVFGSETKQSDQKQGELTEQNTSLRYVATTKLPTPFLLRTGLGYDRFSFGTSELNPGVALPNTLQSTALLLGTELKLDEKWTLRADISPGLYSDFVDLGSDDFNAPFLLGASYSPDKNLQWFFGLRVDVRSQMYLLPAAGVRWRFAEKWTLLALAPRPRLEYELNDAVKLFVGGSLLGGTYKVNKNFGSEHGQPLLNNAVLDYTEVRTGGGATWEINPALSLNADAGYQVWRSFHYHNASTKYVTEPAPYVNLSLSAKF
jgi:hypothetical protein